LILVLFAFRFLRAEAVTIGKAGDIAENLSRISPATRQPRQLSDFEGKFLVLDWFAGWSRFVRRRRLRSRAASINPTFPPKAASLASRFSILE
jgi:hypothetical protein